MGSDECSGQQTGTVAEKCKASTGRLREKERPEHSVMWERGV